MRYTEKDRDIFSQPADDFGKWLIGKLLCRRLSDGSELRFRITETEAYCHDDSACYGKDGKITDATAPLFDKGGVCCIYANMLLIVCGKPDEPDNVLIRQAGDENKCCKGPVLLCETLGINKEMHGMDLLDSNSPLWIEDDGKSVSCYAAERIGLGKDVLKKDRERKHRFTAI